VSMREFKDTGQYFHNGIIEMFVKDKQLQKQMREEFTQKPEDFRERMMYIEATAQGLQQKDGAYFNTSSKKQQSDFVSYLVNMAGSKTEDSSVYLKIEAA